MTVNNETSESGQGTTREDTNASIDMNLRDNGLDASDYHPMATVAELLVMLRDENKTNNSKNLKQQYTYMEFVDKITGEVLTQRVVF